jgi:hypothetical protein
MSNTSHLSQLDKLKELKKLSKNSDKNIENNLTQKAFDTIKTASLLNQDKNLENNESLKLINSTDVVDFEDGLFGTSLNIDIKPTLEIINNQVETGEIIKSLETSLVKDGVEKKDQIRTIQGNKNEKLFNPMAKTSGGIVKINLDQTDNSPLAIRGKYKNAKKAIVKSKSSNNGEKVFKGGFIFESFLMSLIKKI